MAELELCPECGVPRIVTTEHAWLNNGDIIQNRNQENRVSFFESDNLDPLFTGISSIIGRSIEPIIIEAVRRTMRAYLRSFVPDEVRERVLNGEINIQEMDKGFMALAKPMGYGRYEVVETRFEGDGDDYHTVSMTEPFSLPICAASHCAAIEAILGYDHAVSYTQVGPHTWNIVAYPYPQPRAFKGRLITTPYEHVDGDFELLECPSCGGPKALSVCKWHLDRGVIMNEPLKRRMATIGPTELDPIFAELEEELGDMIPQVVVEAQRRFTRTGFYSMDDVHDVGDFRIQLAMRGLGNLRELKIGRRGLHMLVENAALPWIIVGMMQGIFEMAFGLDTDLDWEVSRGNLRMELIPRTMAIAT
jgi:hypothetical protein